MGQNLHQNEAGKKLMAERNWEQDCGFGEWKNVHYDPGLDPNDTALILKPTLVLPLTLCPCFHMHENVKVNNMRNIVLCVFLT